jgi:iron complex outermembrane recepter protein
MDNRLQVNGDIFYYDYKGYQVVDVAWVVNEDYPDGTVKANFFNADKAKNYGAEIETTALVGDATEMNLNLAYLKNEYMSDFFVHADPFGPALNMKGKTMPHSPEFTVKTSIAHTFYFSDNSSLKPNISYRWTDKQYYGTLISDDTLGPAYSIVDVSLNYSSGKNWSLNLYSNNALNEHYYTGSVQQATLVYFPGNPRTTGLTMNVKF